MYKVYVGLFIAIALLLAGCGSDGTTHYNATSQPSYAEVTTTAAPTAAPATVAPTLPEPLAPTAPANPTEPPMVVVPLLASEALSVYGLQAAWDFLSQMPTMFADAPLPFTGARGYWNEVVREGQFHMGWEQDGNYIREIFSDETPPYYFRFHRDADHMPLENHGFFDRYGNHITDAPWILGDTYATEFRLWDFDGSGIPVITVYYLGLGVELMHNTGAPGRLFKYVDGQFVDFPGVWTADTWRSFTHTNWSSFHRCADGDLWRSDVGFGGAYVIWLDSIAFIHGEMVTDPAARFFFEHIFSFWDNYRTGEMYIPLDHDLYISDQPNLHQLAYEHLGINLTRILPLVSDW